MQKHDLVVVDADRVAASLGSPIVDRLVRNQQLTEQTEVIALDGRQYRPANIVRANGRETLQLVRAVPKVRGKAARKAEKRERQRQREHDQAIVDGLELEEQARRSRTQVGHFHATLGPVVDVTLVADEDEDHLDETQPLDGATCSRHARPRSIERR